MSYEPLRTDEKLEKPVKRKPDMDSTFLTGCFTVAVLSLPLVRCEGVLAVVEVV